jgi:hypothetical protein
VSTWEWIIVACLVGAALFGAGYILGRRSRLSEEDLAGIISHIRRDHESAQDRAKRAVDGDAKTPDSPPKDEGIAP